SDKRCVLQHDSTNRPGPFSPDGRWLIGIRSFSSSHQELWLIDLEQTDKPRLLTAADKEAIYHRPEWSPEGRALYCLTDVDRDLAAPARLDVATGKIAYVANVDKDVDETALDPTGRRLAYAVNDDGEARVVVHRLSDGQEQDVHG